jgi:myo-inositol 2-dehydrogenase / D-chiro-inositol 1-dehydrogenase
VNWFMGTHPEKAFGYGGRQVRTNIGDIMDNLAVTFQFGNGVVFSYAANQFAAGGFRDVGEVFFCEKGVITTSRKGCKVFREGKKEPQDFPTAYEITDDAVNAFVDGARTGNIENAAPGAVQSTITAIMAREAIYAKRETTWGEINKG